MRGDKAFLLMKISELSERSGIPLPTIKFYIREGLLPPGERTQRNQAEYGEGHLARLSLIRALREEGGLSIEVIARALAAADRTQDDDFVVAAVDALERPMGTGARDQDGDHAARMVALAKKRGWDVRKSDKSVQNAARALALIERAYPAGTDDDLAVYLDAAERIVAHEIPKDWAPEEAHDQALRYALLGTVLFEPFILALRRMGHVAHTRAAQKRNRERAAKKPSKKPRRRTTKD